MKKQDYRIVAISPKTKKVLKRPRQYQEVIPALKGPAGSLKPLNKFTQKYFKGDFERLNKLLENTAGGNFILYEQKTPTIARDKKTGEKLYQTESYYKKIKGKKKKFTRYKLDADKKKIPLYKIKITSPKWSKAQRPLLYVKGRARRELDIGFKRGHKRLARTKEKIHLAKPNQLRPIAIQLKGPTIKSALQQLQLNATLKQIKNAEDGLYYSVVIVIKDPSGKITRIPISDSWFPKPKGKTRNNKPIEGFLPDSATYMKIPGFTRYPAMRQKLGTVSNLHSKIAWSIRRALMSQGYQFTSLVNLNKIEERAVKFELPLLQKSDNWDSDKEERFYHGIDALYKYSPYGYYKNLPKKITRNWEVILYIKFELY